MTVSNSIATDDGVMSAASYFELGQDTGWSEQLRPVSPASGRPDHAAANISRQTVTT
jgi:hypothetical protein